ncbi:ABC transporter substrate-binding protein [Roseomonas elaeocarpi]|uniref:ABC transporter substrate-binding protein n=1 Tax=Roseomonas elaeocarpi TaxID=907779 RepID=A0ABV6JUL6_9PROT
MKHRALPILSCLAASALTLALGGGSAAAQELRVGLRAALDNPDPASSYSPNRNITLQIYEPLLLQDASIKPVAGLAVSWRMRDPLTWELKLREGVRFTDGSPLTAQDVIASIRRAQNTDAPQTYKSDLREVVAVEAEDPLTVVIRTRNPAPTLTAGLATFGIVSAKATEGATSADFNGGRAAIGTGPYRWVQWTPGAGVTLSRNDNYWGGTPRWSKVEARFIPNDSARVAGLLSGDLDVVDAVPAELLGRIRAEPKTQVISTNAIMMLYLQLDQSREQTPYATGDDGKPLPHNPFRDLRVRQAVTHAINRAAIAERALQNSADPAGQFMAPGLDSHDPSLKPATFDPALSRRLLAEAGYPKGFNLSLACSNDRYPGDARVCQALGQMFGAVGIRTQVDTMPVSILFRRRVGGGPGGGPDVSALMAGYGAPNGLASSALQSLVQTMDRDRGIGGNNYGGFSDAALDRMVDTTLNDLDPAKRAEAVRAATARAMEQVAVVPVYFTHADWGLRRDLTMVPRADSFTFFDTVQPKP